MTTLSANAIGARLQSTGEKIKKLRSQDAKSAAGNVASSAMRGYVHLRRSLLFDVLLLFLFNVVVYYTLTGVWSDANLYERAKMLILVANVALLLVVIPTRYILRRASNRKDASINYVRIVAFFVGIVVSVSMSLMYFVYFIKPSSTENSGWKKAIVVTGILVLYISIFISNMKAVTTAYDRINQMPFRKYPSVVQAVLNLVMFVALYLVVCLPFDLFRLVRNAILGRGDMRLVVSICVILLLVIGAIVYGKKMRRVSNKLNERMAVVQKESVYLDVQTKLGRFYEVVPWERETDDVLNEMHFGKEVTMKMPNGGDIKTAVVRDPYDDEGAVERKARLVFAGEISVQEALEDLAEYLRDDVFGGIKNWLVQPDEPPEKEGFFGGSEDEDQSADGEKEEKEEKEKVFLLPKDRVQRVDNSLSLWLYLVGANYKSEVNLVNVGGKIVVSLGKDGSTVYVDMNVPVGEDGKPLPTGSQSVESRHRVLEIGTLAHQRWNHLALTTTHDGKIHAFVNGVLVATNRVNMYTRSTTDDGLVFLGHDGGAKGMVKEVYYYHKTLTKADVMLLHNHLAIFV